MAQAQEVQGMEDVGCVPVQGGFTGATHTLPAGFHIIFACGKLTGKVASCDHVMAGCHNHHKLTAKHLNPDHCEDGATARSGLKCHLFSIVATLNSC